MPFAKTFGALSLAALVGSSLYTPIAQGFDFGDMMNPGRWMGGNRDRYDDYYDGPWGDPYGGYGGGPWSAPFGAPGYGYPGYGYGTPGYYGAPALTPPAAAPALTPPAAGPSAPAVDNAASQHEIDALKRRIEELETAQRPAKPPASAPTTEWPSAPAFRPMNQY
jgi:hypothetical protein